MPHKYTTFYLMIHNLDTHTHTHTHIHTHCFIHQWKKLSLQASHSLWH